MKDWAISFIAAVVLVAFIIYCVKIMVWAYVG